MPISTDDLENIEKLRALVKDEITPYYDTDFNLLRWLKGHDYNFDLILPKLRNHLLFRKSHWDLDGMADRERNHPIHQHWKGGLTGAAVIRPNAIVNIEQTGPNDYWGMLQTYSINEVLKARVHDLESMLRAVMDLEKQTGEQCSIMYFMDLNGLKFDRRTTTLITGALASISAFMAEHYVEMVHTFVLVNVPTFIHAIWTLARPLLPEKTKNKVHILGSNWREEVLKYANADVLPTFWNLDGETGPFGAALQRAVPFSENEYYKKEISEKAELFTISAGKADYFDAIVEEGESLEWIIDADGNFAFCIFKVDNDHLKASVDTLERIYPKFSKVPGPTIVPLIDSIKNPKPGRYRFWFSNEHAWFHTLKIRAEISPKRVQK
ncbi:unnamed protein product, partial [Mesorhabditis belari]|uniref:CRAL-TRIO domain-containing protein n=1 Tax=Mesorhabditis belari TaxID=2138241 RepID=A0AAF3EM80_9BILA